MEIYESEEQQVEALQKWWHENSTVVLIGIGLGLAAILSWNYWLDYKKEQTLKASILYSQLLKEINSHNNETVDRLANQLKAEFNATEYAIYSLLIQAKTKVDQGDLVSAKELLQTLSSQKKGELSQLATIRLVRLLLATGEYEKGLQIINQIDPEVTVGFSDNYDELVGDLYVALDRVDEARSAYQKALHNGYQSPLLQFKLDDLTPSEKLESIK
jgi:predicted negative regulator of RcsB-dependent stress response